MNKKVHLLPCVLLFFSAVTLSAFANQKSSSTDTSLNKYNVSWNTPGPGSAQSMPLGNGDIGLNVWVEKNGDLVFYIGKTDAWDGEPEKNEWMKQGGVLMKLGRVRVSFNQDCCEWEGMA